MIVTLSLIKFEYYSYDWYKTKERKRKNAFKRFEAKIKKNAFISYWRINITPARWSKNINEKNGSIIENNRIKINYNLINSESSKD